MNSLYRGTSVIELGDTDFNLRNNTLRNNKGCGMIMFYAPWCPHCQNKRDTYVGLADRLNRNGSDYMIYSVNVTDNGSQRISEKNNVTTIPRLIEADNGRLIDYDGDYSPDDILKNARKHIKKKVSKEQTGKRNGKRLTGSNKMKQKRLCDNLENNNYLPEIKNLAKSLGITISKKNKRELCQEISKKLLSD